MSKMPDQIIGSGDIISNGLVFIPVPSSLENNKEGYIIRSNDSGGSDFKVSFDNGVNRDTIDFNQYTVLGKFAGGKCYVIFERNVFRDDTKKQVIYHIIVHQCGWCDLNNTDMNWVLVPKIPDNYEVVFEVKEKQWK
jgi:hypothetical protein